MKAKNRLIGQKCQCFFTGAAMLCKVHAAAPQLLAALKECNRQITQWRKTGKPDLVGIMQAQDAARAAISKAEGR